MTKTIKELVEEAGVKLIPIGENIYRGSCPFHVNVNTPSFTVYTSTNSWFCFGESIGGDHISFLSRLEGISYKAAKEKIQGNTDVLDEIVQTLDGLAVKDEVDYSDELNMSVSKTCRDIMYRKPEKITMVMEFLKKLDGVLQKPINSDTMKMWIERSRELSK